jgi:hypothetical protein
VLFDDMKTVVLGQDLVQGTIQYNERFRDFCRYDRFRDLLAWPYRAQTKGKVELSISMCGRILGRGLTLPGFWIKTVKGFSGARRSRAASTVRRVIPRDRLAREDLAAVTNPFRYDIREYF